MTEETIRFEGDVFDTFERAEELIDRGIDQVKVAGLIGDVPATKKFIARAHSKGGIVCAMDDMHVIVRKLSKNHNETQGNVTSIEQGRRRPVNIGNWRQNNSA